jgi:hypothetical protein
MSLQELKNAPNFTPNIKSLIIGGQNLSIDNANPTDPVLLFNNTPISGGIIGGVSSVNTKTGAVSITSGTGIGIDNTGSSIVITNTQPNTSAVKSLNNLINDVSIVGTGGTTVSKNGQIITVNSNQLATGVNSLNTKLGQLLITGGTNITIDNDATPLGIVINGVVPSFIQETTGGTSVKCDNSTKNILINSDTASIIGTSETDITFTSNNGNIKLQTHNNESSYIELSSFGFDIQAGDGSTAHFGVEGDVNMISKNPSTNAENSKIELLPIVLGGGVKISNVNGGINLNTLNNPITLVANNNGEISVGNDGSIKLSSTIQTASIEIKTDNTIALSADNTTVNKITIATDLFLEGACNFNVNGNYGSENNVLTIFEGYPAWKPPTYPTSSSPITYNTTGSSYDITDTTVSPFNVNDITVFIPRITASITSLSFGVSFIKTNILALPTSGFLCLTVKTNDNIITQSVKSYDLLSVSKFLTDDIPFVDNITTILPQDSNTTPAGFYISASIGGFNADVFGITIQTNNVYITPLTLTSNV